MGLKRETYLTLDVEVDGVRQEKPYEGRTYLDVLKALNRFEIEHKSEIFLAKKVVARVSEVTRIKEWSESDYRWHLINQDSSLYKTIVLKNHYVDVNSDVVVDSKDGKYISTR